MIMEAVSAAGVASSGLNEFARERERVNIGSGVLDSRLNGKHGKAVCHVLAE